MTEYEFTLPDGTRRYEFCDGKEEVFMLGEMHGAVSARPLTGELAELYDLRKAEKAAAREKRAA